MKRVRTKKVLFVEESTYSSDNLCVTWVGNPSTGGIINTNCTPPFWYCGRCNQAIPNRHRNFPSFCGAATVPVKARTPIHKIGGLIIIHYSERALHWWLQEYDKGDELYTWHHWTTTDPVNKQFWKHKVVRWCRIVGAQGHEYPH